MDRSDLGEHLKFFDELGVEGVSRDPVWRKRAIAGTSPDAEIPVNPEGVTISPQPGAPANLEGVTISPQPGAPAKLEGVTISPQPGAPAKLEGVGFSPADAAPRDSADPAAAGLRPASFQTTVDSTRLLTMLREDVGPACTRCKLHALGRTQVVFGVGNPDADLMFVGEAPGADEDEQGEPFVGRAGQLLTRIIEAIGLRRDDVYIANIIKCRPPGNRNPEPDEVEQCEPFLFQQVAAIKPKVVVALGKFAAQSLLRTTDPITRLRGRSYNYRGATLVPTFHPAYLLRNPSAKREVWDDMKKVRAILQGTE